MPRSCAHERSRCAACHRPKPMMPNSTSLTSQKPTNDDIVSQLSASRNSPSGGAKLVTKSITGRTKAVMVPPAANRNQGIAFAERAISRHSRQDQDEQRKHAEHRVVAADDQLAGDEVLALLDAHRLRHRLEPGNRVDDVSPTTPLDRTAC